MPYLTGFQGHYYHVSLPFLSPSFLTHTHIYICSQILLFIPQILLTSLSHIPYMSKNRGYYKTERELTLVPSFLQMRKKKKQRNEKMSFPRIIIQDFGFSVQYSAPCYLFCFLDKNFENMFSIHHPSLNKRLLNIIHEIFVVYM